MMQVRATKTGYYNHGRIKEGQIFVLTERKGLDHTGKKIVLSPEAQFSEKWMIRVNGSDDPPIVESKQASARGKSKASPAKQSSDDSDVI